MRSKEEHNAHLEMLRARAEKKAEEHGEKINRQILKAGAVAKSAAAKTAKTAARSAKKTQ